MTYKDFKTSDLPWPPRFTRLELGFSNGRRLAFTDQRRFGRVWLIPEDSDPYQTLPLSKLGPDALKELPPVSLFIQRVRQRRRVPIKTILLDQSFVSGIGNWIADEVLFQSHIHPGSLSMALEDPDLAQLHESIQRVLAIAVHAKADFESFPKSWIFHSR
jgi:formamidopyrimidine-DNA glycosylase